MPETRLDTTLLPSTLRKELCGTTTPSPSRMFLGLARCSEKLPIWWRSIYAAGKSRTGSWNLGSGRVSMWSLMNS